jgi:2-keto-4-pentenoate hydratase/2-oxohepta-3-ene-1,7-dioic acid hydratase in catechol pathway
VPKEPLLFLKPPSSVIGPGDNVQLPPQSQKVEHEVELAVVVGKRLRRANEVEAAAAIFGYTAACDVTARDLQRSDGQWTRGKGFDTFCPLGPVIVTSLDVRKARLVCRVNGEVRQDGVGGDMVFSVAMLLAYTSQVMTLNPGDVFLTGTPAGVGPLASGNKLELEISGIGTLVVGVL